MRWSMTTTMTVFLLFFGLSLLEALKYRSWLAAFFWIAVAVAFLVLGARGRARDVER